MNKAEKALYELNEVDELAEGNSPVHRFSALCKLLTTVIYILILMSFGKYDLTGVLCMAVYPLIAYPLSRIKITTGLRKMLPVMPLVAFVGIFNPLLDRQLIQIAGMTVRGGWVSFLVLLVKGILVLLASFLLAATTKMDAIGNALRKLHIPQIMVTMLLLTYRYISLLIEEVAVMTTAYHLRAPNQKGIHISAWGSFFGQLLLRTMDKAKALYLSMELRGYNGEFPLVRTQTDNTGSIVWLISWTAVSALIRFYGGFR